LHGFAWIFNDALGFVGICKDSQGFARTLLFATDGELGPDDAWGMRGVCAGYAQGMRRVRAGGVRALSASCKFVKICKDLRSFARIRKDL